MIKSTVLSKSSFVGHLFIKRCSAPNISGTSVKTQLATYVISLSETEPTSGFAVMPDKPSEPPHFKPTISFETGTGVLSKVAAYAFNSSIILTPSSISSSESCVFKKRTLFSS